MHRFNYDKVIPEVAKGGLTPKVIANQAIKILYLLLSVLSVSIVVHSHFRFGG